MKKTPAILILLPLLLAMIACNDPKPVTDTLHRAEALMNEHPDSAWTVLNTLSPDEMGQNRTRAHYALLYTQAQDKNYIDETNDSLISVAVDYYRDTDDVRHKFLSYYYKGRVLANAEDYLNAMTCYMEAEQLADEVSDDYLVGLLYAELGRIYRLYYDYPKSLEAYLKAAECYERAGKIRHRSYMWLNLSGVYRNINRYDESERLLLKALDAAKQDGDAILVESCLGDLVMMCIEKGEMLAAKTLYKELTALVGESYGSANFVGQIARMYIQEKDYIRAKQSIERGWKRAKKSTDSITLYLSSAELLSALGDIKVANQEFMKGIGLQSQTVHQVLQQPVLTAQRDFLSERLELESYRLRIEKKLRILSAFLGVLLIAIMSYVFRRIMKKRREEARRMIGGLQQQNKETEKQKERAEKDKEQLKKENLKISSLLLKMNEEKSVANETIRNLKNDISTKEKESNAEISGLLQKLKVNKEESERSIANLKQELVQKKKDWDALSSLLDDLENKKEVALRTIQELNRTVVEKEESRQTMMSLVQNLENEKEVALRTIQELNRTVVEKEESRQAMMSLIQNLENENKVNVDTIANLRQSLYSIKTIYQQYVQKTEKIQKDLQDSIGIKSEYISALLKDKFEFMGEWILLYEEELTLKNYREKNIRRAIDDTKTRYFKGKNAILNLEKQVNLYCDNVMLYFREEIQLNDEKDYCRVCCMFAGIPPYIIAWMMDEKVDVIYQRKSRLRKKIASSPCLHQTLFLKALPK